jgi:ABC-type ATPase with predicted acetyltransferase domain
MERYRLAKSFAPKVFESERTEVLCRIFGVTKERLSQPAARHNCTVRINEGDIVFITGASGAGKSILLSELENKMPKEKRVNLCDFEMPADRAVIDCISGDVVSAMRLLTSAGLGDVFSMLNCPQQLSEGQQYRLRLAMALASGKKVIFADEFCSRLDRITAGAICRNVRRLAKRDKVTFVLASSLDDIAADLLADVIIVKDFCGNTDVIYKKESIRAY